MTPPARSHLLGVEVGSTDWLKRVTRVGAGKPTKWLEVPAADAQRLLRATTRLVADLPADSNQDVVWVSGSSELLVFTDQVTLTCNVGLVTIGIPVSCDQTRGAVEIGVPLAVGTQEEPRGLFMSTFSRPRGPEVVTEPWAGALTAFAWESLLTLARQLSGAAGSDRQGRSLVPVALASGRNLLMVRSMARHEG